MIYTYIRKCVFVTIRIDNWYEPPVKLAQYAFYFWIILFSCEKL